MKHPLKLRILGPGGLIKIAVLSPGLGLRPGLA